MKLLHVVNTLDPRAGGVSQAVRSIARALASHGWKSEAVTADAQGAQLEATCEFSIHALGPGKFGWAYAPRLRPWLAANLPSFDAVMLHGLWQHPGVAIAGAIAHMRRAGQPAPRFFVMPHGMLDPYFQRAPDRRIKALRNWFYWKLLERRTIEIADALLFTCEEEKELAREAFRPYAPRRELVAGLGVEEPPARTAAMAAAFAAHCPAVGGRPYLLFLSRIHPKKGVDLLLRAYAGARWKNAAPDLVVAGPCEDAAYHESLRAQARALGLEGTDTLRLHWVGMLTGDAKWGALYGCEAFVLPSHQENFGIAVVEALACGRPVLISNRVNIWREIQGSGFVSDDNDEGTRSLLEAWDANCGEAGMEMRARSCFDKYYAMEAVGECFADILKR